MTAKSLTFAAVLVLMFCLFTDSSKAQQTTQVRITGTVFDQANAVLPNAQVKATNILTHLEGTATTGPDGTYTILSLVPGTYTVEAVASGFRKFVDNSVIAYAGDTRRVDIHLQVGTVSETVNVTSGG